jgi:hypothetical protein
VIETMRADGLAPCVVLQTSPGNLQVWLHVSATPCHRGRPVGSASNWPRAMAAMWPARTGVIWADWPASPTKNRTGVTGAARLLGSRCSTLTRSWWRKAPHWSRRLTPVCRLLRSGQ